MLTMLLFVSMVITAPISSQAAGTHPAASTKTQASPDLGKLPLRYEVNRGQFGPSVLYQARAAGYTLWLSSDGFTFGLTSPQPATAADEHRLAPDHKPQSPNLNPPALVHIGLVGASDKALVTASGEYADKSNYYIGNDPAQWHSDVPSYAHIEYQSIYPGINLAWHKRDGQPEYDFILQPGANPSAIQMKISGANGVEIQNGSLVLLTAADDITQPAPTIYQQGSAGPQSVSGGYRLLSSDTVGFNVGAYDPALPLTIDPLVLGYSTYYGGSGDDHAIGVATDSNGIAYVTGQYDNYIPFLHTYDYQAFVIKLRPDGSAPVYTTLLGGNGIDEGRAIAVDGVGNAYVTGATSSTNLATPNGYQTTYGGGQQDVFFARLDVSGHLTYATYLGGGSDDPLSSEWPDGVAIDGAGNAYLVGNTDSHDFPLLNPLKLYSGLLDAFVAKLNPNLNGPSSLIYSTYLGGLKDDYGESIVADSSGNAYVTGYSASFDFPFLNAYQPQIQGSESAFITKLLPSGNSLGYSTFFGHDSFGTGIARDSSGNIYITGETYVSVPIHNAYQNTKVGSNGYLDMFISKLNPNCTLVLYSTYLGGSVDDKAQGIAVDNVGNAYVSGYTQSTNLPIRAAIQAQNNGQYDALVARINTNLSGNSSLIYSTYLGGSDNDYAEKIALAGTSVYVVGQTHSLNFPTANPYQGQKNLASDAFISKLTYE